MIFFTGIKDMTAHFSSDFFKVNVILYLRQKYVWE